MHSKILNLTLILVFLLAPFKTKAETLSLTQDDWSGGSGQETWEDDTKFNQEEGEGLYTENGLKMKINADTVVGQDDFNNSAPDGASAASDNLYLPKGSFFDGENFFVADTENNRVLVYNSIPTTDGEEADVVIGQTDLESASSGSGPDKLNRPYTVYSNGNMLIIADKGNNRVLIYNSIPTENGVVADVVVGQDNFYSVGSGTTSSLLNAPVGVYFDGIKLFVSEYFNNRVLIYNSIPTTNGAAADVVIGQDDFVSNSSGVSATEMTNPFGIYSTNGKLFVMDSFNSRVLIYNTIPTTNGVAADVVIGQDDFVSNDFGASSTRLGYAAYSVYSDGTKLFIADASNNRVLVFNSIPITNGAAADVVIGQTDFTSSTSGISSTKINAPYNVCGGNGKLIITDRSNNRDLIFNSIPVANGAAADVVVGQDDFITNKPNNADGINERGIKYQGNSILAGNKLLISDYTNNRVLIYNSVPTTDGVAADVVIGQDDFVTGTSGTSATKLKGPENVYFDGTKLFVVDYGNHRILIYNSIPTTNGAAADVVIGQDDLVTGTSGTSATKLKNPKDAYFNGSKFFVSDYGNHRILIYNSIPTTNGAAADVVIGQDDFVTGTSGTSATKLKNPYGIYSNETKLFVADYYNNRVLIYNTIPTTNGAAADVVIGQTDFTASTGDVSLTNHRYPCDVYSNGTKLFVADYFNSRILIYNEIPTENGAEADQVVGQRDFITDYAGLNSYSLNYGKSLFFENSKLLVSDYNNNRLLIFNSHEVSSTLTSSTFTSETDQDWGPISWQAETPEDTDIKVEISTDNKTTWNEVKNGDSYIGRGKTMTYRVTLISKDGLSSPIFQSISFGQAAKDDTGIMTTLKNIFGNNNKQKVKNNQVIKSQSKSPTLRGEEPKLKNGKVEVYLNNKLEKEIAIDQNGYWKEKLKLKDKSYTVIFKYIDEFDNILKTERFKLKVDSDKPTFKEKINKTQTVAKTTKIYFTAKDEGLGIDYYKIKLLNDKGRILKPFNKQTKDYYLVPQNIPNGNYTLVIRAYDEAKNYVEKKINLSLVDRVR